MRRIALVGLAALLLAGCGGAQVARHGDFDDIVVLLSDGRSVVCITYDGPDYEGGLSCDWDASER